MLTLSWNVESTASLEELVCDLPSSAGLVVTLCCPTLALREQITPEENGEERPTSGLLGAILSSTSASVFFIGMSTEG